MGSRLMSTCPAAKGMRGADTVKMLQEALTKSLASGFGTLERKTCELSGVLRRSGASLWSRYRGIYGEKEYKKPLLK